MTVNSTVTAYPKAGATYPSLWEHIPTGCVILFVNADDGWLVGASEKNVIPSSVGTKWTNRSPLNYKPFYGTVTLGNLV